MIQFSRLRLHGFKSFIDRTELEIGPGLNGIVGPNGCGKSNLVEALRWGMGESSAKRMRGGTGNMDDVIFNGTERRPARNMAEVSLVVDNSARTAPSPWNIGDEIEIVRKIERDHGSSFRINGKSVRARDTHLFFADVMSGANSPYLVSQGRVTVMIQSKPSERRMILEEAAGITGLYARRHEAELRLRATDTNLKRLDDIVGGMDARLQSLKRQARQAARYRELSIRIRMLEITIAALEWRAAFISLRDVERRFDEVEARVAERMTVVSQLTRTQATQAMDLPELRRKDAESSAALQHLRLNYQRLEDEAARIDALIKDATSQQDKLVSDRAHETQALDENTRILERLETEEKALSESEGDRSGELTAREAARAQLQDRLKALESELTDLTQTTAQDRAQRQSLENQVAQDQRRHDLISARLRDVKTSLEQKRASHARDDAAPALRADIDKYDQEADRLRTAIAALEKAIADMRGDVAQRQLESVEAERARSRLESEAKALRSVLEGYSVKGFRPVLDEMKADSGYEVALSRALGDTLMGSLDPAAPVSWSERGMTKDRLPALPEGVIPLEPHVDAPPALQLALSQIGFAEDDEAGARLAGQLHPGQAIVSANGAYWRWDGLHIRAVAADRHALQLKQKNTLAELEAAMPAAQAAHEAARFSHAEAERQLQASQNDLSTARSQLTNAECAGRDARNALNRAIEAQSARNAELAKLEEALSIAGNDLGDLTGQLQKNQAALRSFDDAGLQRRQARLEALKTEVAGGREALHEAIREFEALRQEMSRRKARLQAIGDERVNLQNRSIRGRERLKDLDQRAAALQERLTEVKGRPEEIADQRESLLTQIAALEKQRATAADRLAHVESELAETTRALKNSEAGLAEAREQRAHAQATAAERQRQLEDIRRQISEQFDVSPEDLLAQAALDAENLPDLDKQRQERERAVRDRDSIGPVNLQAEQEAAAVESELAIIVNERVDLEAAIAELRGGIQKLNKEARERLQSAFEHVNAHFREMFTRLFSGGKAHLALIDSDDPLDAGLEIFAQPPGKALQSLSLLSGGEQTLTAVALIFAMFLTNPSPICVLDEVDAPLDDANVDRFCDMLDEFAEKGQTRFLVITHHRLTMARMDRLYGVTMSERGVSQLVSVDMNQQLDFLAA